MEWKRVALVTAGLSATGAVVTGLLGVALFAIFTLVLDGYRSVLPLLSEFALDITLTGARYGAVLGPAAAWLLMRRVPLGLAIAGTSLGTTAGVALAFATQLDGRVCIIPCFLASALVLRRMAARRERTPVCAASLS